MRTTFAHISDTHVQDGSRAPEIANVLSVFAQEAAKAGVDFIVHTGDVMDQISSPTERKLFVDVLKQWQQVAPVCIIKGNHDRPHDLEIFEQMKGAHAVTVFEGTGIAEYLISKNGQVRLFALPWYDKSYFAAKVYAEGKADDVDADSLGQRLQQQARSLLVAIRQLALEDPNSISILAGHVLVGGSVVSTGQTLIGTTVEMSPHDLADAGCAYVALGHIHKPQEWIDGKVAYAGSPWRLNFGEPEEKGFRLITVENLKGQSKLISNDFIPLPARRIELVEIDLTSAKNRKAFQEDPLSLMKPHLKRCGDALVRVRYHIDANHLADVNAEALAESIKRTGAFEVKAEAIVQQKARARAPEIVNSQSLTDELKVYIEAKGITVTEERMVELESKTTALEEAINAT